MSGLFEDDESGERSIAIIVFAQNIVNARRQCCSRICHECDATLVDPDKKLKEALNLKDALVFECQEMRLSVHKDDKGKSSVRISYIGETKHKYLSFGHRAPKNKNRPFINSLFVPILLINIVPLT